MVRGWYTGMEAYTGVLFAFVLEDNSHVLKRDHRYDDAFVICECHGASWALTEYDLLGFNGKGCSVGGWNDFECLHQTHYSAPQIVGTVGTIPVAVRQAADYTLCNAARNRPSNSISPPLEAARTAFSAALRLLPRLTRADITSS